MRKKSLNVASFLFPLFIGSLYVKDLVPHLEGHLREAFVIIRILSGIIFCMVKFSLV